jgi:hypothetical protein
MTIRSGLVVLLKCFMILLGFELALWLIGAAVVGQIPKAFIAMASLALVPLMLVYWFAEVAVDLMTPKSNEILADTPIRFGDLQSIAFSALGAYITYNAVHQTLYLMLFLWQNDVLGGLTMPIDIYANPIVSWIVGLYLLVGAPQLRRWLVSLRRADPSVE